MSWALHELGLSPDADERAVKRAYAARLKATRPEDDPEGFQRLHEAYRAALEWTQSREADADIDDDTDASVGEPPSGAVTRTLSQEALFALLDAQPAESSESPLIAAPDEASRAIFADIKQPDEPAQFDPDVFLDDCIALAMRSRDGELQAWLNAQPALWSLTHKTHIAPWLLHRLHERRPPIEARRFDALAEFFGLFDLHSGYDAYTIQRLRHRLHLHWEVETRQIRALAERTGQDGSSVAANLRQAGSILKQLSRPLQWPQALWVALMPGYPSAVRTFLRRLDFGNLEDLPPPIREDQIAFWDAAGDRSAFSKPRWAVSVARLFAYTLGVSLVFALFAPITPPESIYRATPIVDVIGTSFTTMLIAWLAYLAYDTFVHWQALPESAPARFPWLRAASIPVLGVGALMAEWLFELGGGGMMISLAVFILALQRYRRRNGLALNAKLKLKAWHFIPAFFGVVMISWISESNPSILSLGILGGSLTLWALDMRKQRAALQN